jgi:hexokinase
MPMIDPTQDSRVILTLDAGGTNFRTSEATAIGAYAFALRALDGR